MTDNTCISCGEIIPEGMIACPNCLVVSKKKLKPCPFCGGVAKILEHYWDVEVYCIECQASNRGDSKAEAIEAWNRRAEDG